MYKSVVSRWDSHKVVSFQYPAQIDKSADIDFDVYVIWRNIWSLETEPFFVFTDVSPLWFSRRWNINLFYLFALYIWFFLLLWPRHWHTLYLPCYLHFMFLVLDRKSSVLALLQLLTEFVNRQGGQVLTKRSRLLLRTCKSIMLPSIHFIPINDISSPIKIWTRHQIPVMFELIWSSGLPVKMVLAL